mgnify:CR=1 FL=1
MLCHEGNYALELSFHFLINYNKNMKYQDLRKIISAPYFSVSDLHLADKTIYIMSLACGQKMQFDQRLQELDFGFLANDVEPFLFDAAQKERVLTFKDYWRTHRVG